MENKPRVCALILARGGSKGVPRKNIHPILGRPLVDYVTRAAKDSGVFQDVWVSTEDKEIKEVVINVCKVKVFDRDPNTAQDHSKCEEAIGHFVDAKADDYDVFCLVQATNPLIHPQHFQEGFEKLLKGNYDSLLSVTRGNRFRWSDGDFSHPLNYDPNNRPNRQNWPGELSENGGFYFFTKNIFLKSRCRLNGKTGTYEMPPYSYVEIDNKHDVDMMKVLCEKYAYKPGPSFNDVKVIIFDVDGTLTDGRVTYDSNGGKSLTFSRIDGHGIKLAQEAGVKIAIITSSSDPCIQKRCDDLNIQYKYLGVKEGKVSCVKEICGIESIDISQVAYMGDDERDIPCLKEVGLAACPRNAQQSVKQLCSFVSECKGGKGAARELCDRVIQSRKIVA